MTPIRHLFSGLLSILLMGIGAFDLKINEQSNAISFFNGNGGPILPRAAIRESQESMPELKDYPLPSAPPMLAPLGGPLGGPIGGPIGGPLN